MIKLFIDKGIVEYATWLVSNTNYGQRGVADGNKRQQLYGLIGQCMVVDALGYELPKPSNEHDGGVDLNYNGLSIDIKTMGRNCDPRPEFVNNLIGLQAHFDVNAYIFTSLNREDVSLTICGWILKKEFMKLADFTPKNGTRLRSDGTSFQTKADLYEIQNNRLNDVYTITQLKEELNYARFQI